MVAIEPSVMQPETKKYLESQGVQTAKCANKACHGNHLAQNKARERCGFCGMAFDQSDPRAPGKKYFYLPSIPARPRVSFPKPPKSVTTTAPTKEEVEEFIQALTWGLKNAGIAMEALASATSMGRNKVAAILQRIRIPSKAEMEALADALYMTPRNLIIAHQLSQNPAPRP